MNGPKKELILVGHPPIFPGKYAASTSSEQIPSAKTISVDGIPSSVIYCVVYVPHTSDNTAPENGWYPPSTVTVLTVSVYAL
jgi:hypothetical protein